MNTFKVRHMEGITQRMIGWVAGVSPKATDFTVGSRVRTLLEACSQELEELYYQVYSALAEQIQTLLFDGFRFPAKAATRATGTVTFARATAAAEDYPIAAGTIVSTRGSTTEPARRFLTVSAVTLATGQTSVEATVRAEQPGPEYNVVAGQINYISSALPGIDTVTNAAGYVNGKAAETDARRAERFLEYVNSLQRGTEPAIRRAIEDQVEDVAGVSVVESPTLYCRRFDASAAAYADFSGEFNLPGGTAFDPFVDPMQVGDQLYIGSPRRFNVLYLGMRRVGYGLNGIWEYWNGSAWTEIPDQQDNSGSFGASDTVEWDWSDVSDWGASVVDDQKAYWVRFTLQTVGAVLPSLSYGWASPPPGQLLVYAHDGGGTLPAAMKTAIELLLTSYRAGGVKASVLAPSILTVPVTLTLELAAGADRATVAATVEAALNSYFANLRVGQRVPREELSQLVMNADDDAILDVNWTAPAGDVDVSPEQLVRLGTLTVN